MTCTPILGIVLVLMCIVLLVGVLYWYFSEDFKKNNLVNKTKIPKKDQIETLTMLLKIFKEVEYDALMAVVFSEHSAGLIDYFKSLSVNNAPEDKMYLTYRVFDKEDRNMSFVITHTIEPGNYYKDIYIEGHPIRHTKKQDNRI